MPPYARLLNNPAKPEIIPTEEESEAQRGQITCPRSYSQCDVGIRTMTRATFCIPYTEPGVVLRPLHILTHLILTQLTGRYSDYLYFTDENNRGPDGLSKVHGEQLGCNGNQSRLAP